MIPIRVIPCLLLKGSGLVKTIKFKEPKYLGDPINAVKIFNEKGVDELVLLDITASKDKHNIKYNLIKEIVSEAFMPIGYGGGIKNLEDAQQLITLGIEKIVINTASIETPNLISDLVNQLGSQSVVVSIDVKKNIWGKYEILSNSGTKYTKLNLLDWVIEVEKRGAGEIMINSIDRDGTMSGYDINLIKSVTERTGIPIIASGGAGKIDDFKEAIFEGKASAVSAGSLFVYHGRHKAVLINYPNSEILKELFYCEG